MSVKLVLLFLQKMLISECLKALVILKIHTPLVSHCCLFIGFIAIFLFSQKGQATLPFQKKVQGECVFSYIKRFLLCDLFYSLIAFVFQKNTGHILYNLACLLFIYVKTTNKDQGYRSNKNYKKDLKKVIWLHQDRRIQHKLTFLIQIWSCNLIQNGQTRFRIAWDHECPSSYPTLVSGIANQNHLRIPLMSSSLTNNNDITFLRRSITSGL